MALAGPSKCTTEKKMCLICLENPSEVTIQVCKHAYCRPCLTKHVELHLPEEGEETFPCPTCNVLCPRRIVALDGKDTDRFRCTGNLTGSSLPGADEPVTGVVRKKPLPRTNCKVCHVRGNEVESVNICEECCNLVLCKECTVLHQKRKATMNHFVAPIMKSNENDALCDAHSEPLGSYCCTCAKSVCPVCVLVDHDEHEIKAFGVYCWDKVEEYKHALELEEKRLGMLIIDQKVLVEAKDTAVAMEGDILKAIDDHAEECIESIIKNKEELKKSTKENFEVIPELSKWLDAMPEVIQKSEEVISRGKALLSEAVLRQAYLEKMTQANLELVDVKEGENEYSAGKERYRDAFAKLRQKELAFYPKRPTLDIGSFEKPNPSQLRDKCSKKGQCVCETCGRGIPKASMARIGECTDRGKHECGTCGESIPGAGSNIRRSELSARTSEMVSVKVSGKNLYLGDQIEGKIHCVEGPVKFWKLGVGGGYFALLSVNTGRYICANNWWHLTCNRENLDDWELFTTEGYKDVLIYCKRDGKPWYVDADGVVHHKDHSCRFDIIRD